MLVFNAVLVCNAFCKNDKQKKQKRHKKQQNYPCTVFYCFKKGIGKIREHAAGALRNGINGHKNLICALHKCFHGKIQANGKNRRAGNYIPCSFVPYHKAYGAEQDSERGGKQKRRQPKGYRVRRGFYFKRDFKIQEGKRKI